MPMKRLIAAVAVGTLLASPGICGTDGLAPRGVVAVAVHDAKGLPIPGVTVTLSEAEGKVKPRAEITPGSGPVMFDHLPQGSYSMRFELSGFFTTTLSNIPVELKAEGPRLREPIVVVLTEGPIWF